MRTGPGGTFECKFLGAFRLTAPDGRRIHIRSRKGIALLAMLATADRGERTRSWLQDKLWGSRGLQQAQNSLRRELSSLRALLNGIDGDLLEADLQSVRLKLEAIDIDVRADPIGGGGAEFLEGIDLAGEVPFTNWLRDMRASLEHRRSPMPPIVAPQPQPQPPEQAKAGPAFALEVLPTVVLGRGGERLPTLASDIRHGLIKHILARKWLPVVLAPEGCDTVSDGGQAGPTRAKARYKLEVELLFDRPTAVRLVLVIKAFPGPQLLWTETLHIGEDLDQGRLDDSIGRLGSTLCREVFYAESRRIRSLKDEELGPGELTHLVRQLVGEVSMDSVALARTYLDRAVAMAPWTAEQKILDAYLKVHAVMGSNYTEQDLARLRPWASAAINADPTDWRGCLLAAAVELWLGNAQLAIAHAGAAKKLCPYNAAISGQLGMAYVWSGEPELAAVELDAALAMSLMERRPYLILCNLALVALMRGRLGQALLFCDQAASCIPELGLAHLLKVDVLVALGRGIEAARVYREMIRDRFDDLIAVVRRQRVLADFWVPRAAQALKIAAQAAEQLEQMPLGDAVRRLGSEGSGR